MADSHANPNPSDITRYGQNYLIEMDGIELYRLLAEAEKDEKRDSVGERGEIAIRQRTDASLLVVEDQKEERNREAGE